MKHFACLNVCCKFAQLGYGSLQSPVLSTNEDLSYVAQIVWVGLYNPAQWPFSTRGSFVAYQD